MGPFRFLACFAFIWVAIWGGEFGMAADQMAFAIAIVLINVYHFVITLIFEKPVTLNPYLQNLWHKMFDQSGYNLEISDFYNLMQEKAFLKTYKKGQVYMHEHDVPDQLSILLAGKMSVWKRDDFQRKSMFLKHESTHAERFYEREQGREAFVGAVYPYEFIDSYEWLSSQGTAQISTLGIAHGHMTSQVTIKVSDDRDECVVLSWKKEMLEAVFKEHPRLRTCIHALVGKDIAEKMLRITGHTVDELMPDVDMVRKAHGIFRISKRADVKDANMTVKERKVLPSMSRRAVNILDDEYHQKVVRETETADGYLHEEFNYNFRNLTAKQAQIKDVLGAGPWCELPDYELNQEPWTCRIDTTQYFHELGNFFDDRQMLVHKRCVRLEPFKIDGTMVDAVKAHEFRTDQQADVTNEQTEVRDAYIYCRDQTNGNNGAPCEVNVYGIPSDERDLNHHLLEQAMHSLQRARVRIANSRLLAMNPAPLESLQPSSDIAEQNQRLSGDLLHYFEMVCKDLRKKDLHEILKWGKWRSFYRPNTCIQRQGEEANYVGVVLQGKLAAYTEDEITRSKKLTHWIDKYHLVGSEDFSSKFRTARRTISMPSAPVPDPEGEGKEDEVDDMYAWVSFREASTLAEGGVVAINRFDEVEGDYKTEQVQLLLEDQQDLKDRIKAAKLHVSPEENQLLITTQPVCLFVWDIKDLKRLMLADPHVESSLSTILRGDITYKLDHASMGSLGTRVCGIPTQARGDQDVRMCNVNPE
jgi:CRP-like cAMP-binding protein